MTTVNWCTLEVGSELPSLVEAPITRHMLGMYAGASGDYNPVHIDSDYVRRETGMPDVFAHGMLSAAWVTRVLTRWVDPTAIKHLSVRFVAITHLGDQAHCHATITEKFHERQKHCVRLQLHVHNQMGEPRILGTAVVEVPCQCKEL